MPKKSITKTTNKTGGKLNVADYLQWKPFELEVTPADTFTTSKVNTGYSIADEIGWSVHRIETIIYPAYKTLPNADGDYGTYGLAWKELTSAPNPETSGIFAPTFRMFGYNDNGGNPVGGCQTEDYWTNVIEFPKQHMLLFPGMLWAWGFSVGFGGVFKVHFVVYFEEVFPLGEAEYREYTKTLIVSA